MTLNTPQVVAFLFDADAAPRSFGRYDAIPKERFFRRVLELDTERQMRFRVLSGDVMLHLLAYRATAADLAADESRVREAGMNFSPDRDLYLLIVWDFIDSLAYGWTTVDLADTATMTTRFANHTTYAIVVVGLQQDVVIASDAVLAQAPWYMGAATVDLGNPLHVRAFDLPHTLSYVHRRLGIVSEHGDVDLIEATSGSDWTAKLPFDAVDVVSPWTEDPKWAVPSISVSPLSERGRLSTARLKSRANPTHFEHVAASLREHTAAIKGDKPTSVAITFNEGPPILDERKFTHYLLTEDPSRRDGFTKAQLFRDVLGITASDWRFLAAQLAEGLATAVPKNVRGTAHGVKYDVTIEVRGRNGERAPVLAAWIIEGDRPPALTTAYILKRGTAAEVEGAEEVPVLPPDRQDDWASLYALASAAGERAAAEAVPTPMFLSGFPPVAEGLCGGATVRVGDARRGFARWLLKTGHGHRARPSGVAIWNVSPTQSVERAEAWAEAFANVLRMNGVPCEVRTYLD